MNTSVMIITIMLNNINIILTGIEVAMANRFCEKDSVFKPQFAMSSASTKETDYDVNIDLLAKVGRSYVIQSKIPYVAYSQKSK